MQKKKSFHNFPGFSPFQLVIGSNQNLPSAYTNYLPTLTLKPSSEIIRNNLNAIHSGQSAFIACENWQKN